MCELFKVSGDSSVTHTKLQDIMQNPNTFFHEFQNYWISLYIF